MGWEDVMMIAAATFSLGAFVIAWLTYRKFSGRVRWPGQSMSDAVGVSTVLTEATHRGHRIAAFVVNPTKTDVTELRRVAEKACREHGWQTPLWFETTEQHPGGRQTEDAIRAGADIVVACGGDGTVRSVASALAGSGIPMGMLPLGTGNLLARNLDIPPAASLEELVAIPLTGINRRIDIGWVDVLHTDRTVLRSQAFLVIAGIGFDAKMIADTDDKMKQRIGWVAYFLGGLRHLHGRHMRVRVQIDQAPPMTKRARTVMIGNCGKLPGGMTLIPDALIDDGWLDLAAVNPRGGFIGWTVLAGEVVAQSTGAVPTATQVIDHIRGRSITIRLDDPEPLQLDGDIVGHVEAIHVRVDPAALVVRVAG